MNAELIKQHCQFKAIQGQISTETNTVPRNGQGFLENPQTMLGFFKLNIACEKTRYRI